MVCSVEGCDRLAHSRGWCMKHYLRQYHGRPMADPPPRTPKPPKPTTRNNRALPVGTRVTDKGGYVRIKLPDHPMASCGRFKAWALEHRVVLFDKIGYGPHLCHWGCGRDIHWGYLPSWAHALVPDHLDNVRDNNDPDNLVASCPPCNNARTNLSKTHCPAGHPYAGDNLYQRDGRGGRTCLACRTTLAELTERRARLLVELVDTIGKIKAGVHR